MMRIVKLVVTLLFVAACAMFAYVFYNDYISVDKTYPTITVESGTLKVKAQKGISDEKLLEGVTAYDMKDGDISDKVIIESISKFTEKGVCNITYAVCDSDKHVTTATRRIKYTGYKSPQFFMNESLCFPVNKFVNITGIIGAKDDIDGDITKNVIITSENFESGIAGTFTLNAKVTNSKGDTTTLEFPLIVEERSASAPVIELSKYMIYVRDGKKPDFQKYVKGVTDSTGEEINIPVTIQTEFDPKEEGVYLVHYYATDNMERQGHTVLTVVVEKKK